MADNIVEEIQRSRQTYSNSSSAEELTLEKARADYRKKAADEAHKREENNIKAQVKLESGLREKGLQENSKEWIKAMKKAQRELNKEDTLDKLKDLEEIYKATERKEAEINEQRRKTNEAILKSVSATLGDKLTAASQIFGDNIKKGLSKAAGKMLSELTNGLDTIMSTYAQYQAKINARIQGTGLSYKNLEDNISKAVGIQPYVKTQDMVTNLAALVDSGIAYNIELRAFIQTMKDNIATTFDATNGTLLRLIRIQQADSTAARLGLEANLTRYFNAMYQNTEYLSSQFDNVSAALLEASSTMTNQNAVAFEYQVQKWLGSMFGVGVSDNAVSGIAQALGMLGSGNVSGLSSSQYQNLLVMAASRAGLSYGELLTGGLTSKSTNALMQAMVGYLQEIASGTNKVVQSELGRVFGVTMSDLQSVLNINTELMRDINEQSLSYEASLAEVMYQLKQLPSRLSIATMMDNVWSNLQWGLGTGIASNPALYGIWKVTSLIQDYTGGINIPSVFAMGSGANLNTTVENLVKLGVVGISSLGMIGDLISGLGSTLDPSSMLTKLGDISNVSVRGRGLSATASGLSTGQTTIIGNASGEDIYSSTLSGAQGEQKEAVADAAKENETQQVVENIRNDVRSLYEMFNQIINPINGMKVYTTPGA